MQISRTYPQERVWGVFTERSQEHIKMVKRGLFLGGSHSQVPIIEEAKRRGHYVITCDYLPHNPGHRLADEYHNVSTTDIPTVLSLAKTLNLDYIMAYASDVAAMTAAIVSEKLGLKYNSVESVRVLSEKDAFRSLQKDIGLCVPEFAKISLEQDCLDLKAWPHFPCIVKPTDSAGSKGVSRVDNPDELEEAIRYARKFGKSGNVIIEEFVDNLIADLHGDGFVQDGKLVFLHLGDHIYSSGSNPFNPMGTIWPSRVSRQFIDEIQQMVKILIKNSGFENGAINVEARVSSTGNIYIMEIGARCGGHFVPQAVFYSSGFNLVSSIMDISVQKKVEFTPVDNSVSAYYAVNSCECGTLDYILINPVVKDMVVEEHLYLTEGGQVQQFTNSSAAIGVLVLKSDSYQRIDDFFKNAEKYVQVAIR